MKKIIVFALIMAISVATPIQTMAENVTQSDAKIQSAEQDIEQIIDGITSEPHPINSDAIQKVKEYIIKYFGDLGYDEIEGQKFEYNDENNVVLGGMRMCTKSELNNILQKLTQIYRSVYGENLVRVILYGSYARGDYNTDSDVDIVAIVHGDRKTLQQQLKKVWDSSCDLELEYDMILSPTVIPYEEFEQYRMDLPYYRNISQEGVVISA